MHRTEGPDFIVESGKNRYKETPTPATVVNKFAMNAIQEEIALAIENYGITLAASGSADRTAGWGQLYQAMLRANMADIRGYGAVSGSDSTAAIVAAIAASNIVFIPSGVFKVTSTIQVPDGQIIIGTGYNSVIQPTTDNDVFQANGSCVISDICYDLNDQNGYALTINLNGDHFQLHRNIYWDKVGDTLGNGMDIKSTTSDQGMVIFDGLKIIANPATVGPNIRFGGASTSVFTPKCIFRHIDPDGKTLGIFINKDATSTSEIRFTDCNLDSDAAISVYEDTRNIIFKNSLISFGSYIFKGCEWVLFQDCSFSNSQSNTINNNSSGEASRVMWKNCRLNTGKITEPDGTVTWTSNINGIYTKRTLNGNQSIGTGGWDKVDFDGASPLIYMSNNLDHQKDDDIWDATNKWLEAKGYGDGFVKINCQIQVDSTDMANTRVALFNSSVHYADFAVRELASGVKLFVFNGTVWPFGALSVQVYNNTGGAFNVVEGSGDLASLIEVEGL